MDAILTVKFLPLGGDNQLAAGAGHAGKQRLTHQLGVAGGDVAGDGVSVGPDPQRRFLRGADRLGEGTARVEGAAGWWIDRGWRIPGEHHPAAGPLQLETAVFEKWWQRMNNLCVLIVPG